jgi:hypothetical protein
VFEFVRTPQVRRHKYLNEFAYIDFMDKNIWTMVMYWEDKPPNDNDWDYCSQRFHVAFKMNIDQALVKTIYYQFPEQEYVPPFALDKNNFALNLNKHKEVSKNDKV